MAGAITGTSFLAGSPTNYTGGANSQLSPAVQQLWSKEILFQAMPILRFEQFAVKKTELGVSPGLTIHFMRYNNLPAAGQLVEGIRMQSVALTASQFDITVAEQGFAVAVTELLLNASFDDVMASAARLLGRNMALYLDGSARDTLRQASSLIYGYNKPALASSNPRIALRTLGMSARAPIQRINGITRNAGVINARKPMNAPGMPPTAKATHTRYSPNGPGPVRPATTAIFNW